MKAKDLIAQKEWAARQLLGCGDEDKLNEAGKIFLSDLRVFCFGTKSPFDENPIEMARRVGRQEVFQRIMNFLNYDYSKFYDLEEDIVDE